MSKTLRRGGYGHPKYQHLPRSIRWTYQRADKDRNQWTNFKVYDESVCWRHSPPASMKAINNRHDRRRWNREATKEEPQLPISHRHWGIWDWW